MTASLSPLRIRSLALALLAGGFLVACGGSDISDSSAQASPETGAHTQEAPDRPSNTQPMPTSPVDLSAFDKLTDDQLRSGHDLAVKEGRYFEPATNNVVTYQLAMRHRFGRDVIQKQLIEFTTEILIQAELAIKRGDGAERARFIQLLDAIDPTLPSLPRLKSMQLGQDAWGEALTLAPSPEESGDLLSDGPP